MKELKIFGLGVGGLYTSCASFIGILYTMSLRTMLRRGKFIIFSKKKNGLYFQYIGGKKGQPFNLSGKNWTLQLAEAPLYKCPNKDVVNQWSLESPLMRVIISAFEEGLKILLFSEDGKNCQLWSFEAELPNPRS